MFRKVMALAVGLGLVGAVGTQASAMTTYPPRAAYGWHGGAAWRGPVYRGGWGYGYRYVAPPVVVRHVWVPGYWVVRPWGRVWVGGFWR